MYQTILFEKKGRVATITLNRPDKMNSITVQLQDELIQALDEAASDDIVAVVIITGAGDAFCGGYDVPTALGQKGIFRTHKILMRMEAFDKPIIAAVNGHAVAEGLQIALASDIIVASQKARFAPTGARLGTICNYAVFTLPRIVGRNKAAEMLFTCDHVSGEDAFEMGLANKVVPAEQLLQAALELADKIKNNAPLSLKYTKQALRKGDYDDESREWATEVLNILSETEDAKEAFTAIAEKRKPIFKGK